MQGQTRQGHHPRDPRRTDTAEPTQSLAPIPEQLNEEDMEEITIEETPAEAEAVGNEVVLESALNYVEAA